jgi:hypothetical protein
MYTEDQEFGAERRLLNALRAVLPAQASPVAVVGSEGAVVHVRAGQHHLLAKWVGRAGLREVRDVLGLRLRPDIIIGSSISLAGRQEASRSGTGWVDESGAAEIVAGTILVSRTGRLVSKSAPPARWTPVVASVAEALLCGVKPTTSATAAATGHSISSTAYALYVLADLGLLRADRPRGPRSGRQVADPVRLLAQYAEAAPLLRPKAELRCGVIWREPTLVLAHFAEQMGEQGTTWAATGSLASMVLAPYLTDIGEGEVYVDAATMPEVINIARKARLEPMEGGRLVLRPFPTNASMLLASDIDGIRVAPWPRVYADLRPVGVRGEEAAEHLRETVGA